MTKRLATTHPLQMTDDERRRRTVRRQSHH